METIFLEDWLHSKIRDEATANQEFRQFLGGRTLKILTRADVENYQLFKLRKMLSYVHERSSFYRELFDRNGIKPGQIQSLEDLSNVPFTDPADLAKNPNRFLCVSHGDVTRVTTFTTSGTTGPQKRVFCTKADLERITDFMGVGMRTVTHSGDVVQIMLPSGSVNNQAELLARGVEKIGGLPVIAGLNKSADEQLELIKRHKPAVIFAVTPAIYRMTQELLRRCPLHELGVRTLFLSSGYLSEPMREHLKNVWQCDVHDHYGLTEMGLGVAVECHAHNGYHFNEADLLLEMVNPKTGQVVTEGEGELVFTTLTRQGTPLIRYRTHDIARLVTQPCPCGAATLLKFGKVTKRVELLVAVGDDDVIYPSLFDEVLYKLPEVVDYNLIVSRVDARDKLDFVVEVTETNGNLRERIFDLLVEEPVIKANLYTGTMSEPEVTIVGLGELPRTGRAKKKITDNRMSARE
jgi:phenylacetate-CoA ligase